MTVKRNTYYYYACADLQDAIFTKDSRFRRAVISACEAQEKLLKAIIECKVTNPTDSVMKTNSVSALLKALSIDGIDNAFVAQRSEMIELGNKYFNMRYPSDEPFYAEKKDAKMAVSLVMTIKKIADSILDTEVRESIRIEPTIEFK